MAYSYVQYTGNGSTVAFSIPFQYISADYLEVRVGGVLTTAYTLPSAASVQMNVAPANGVVVDIRRNTPKVSRLVDFQDASILTEASLDLSADQAFHIAQETLDDAEAAIKLVSDGTYEANGARIKNVANPVDAQDVATKNWVETGLTSSVNAAATSASNASSSAASASSSASAASTSASNASTSASTATTKASEASTSASNAAASASTATTKASEASTSASNAAASASTASTQAGNASTSASNAASSAAAAATSYDSFDDRYLGPKASDPTLDNDGAALLTGALYFNTTTNEMRVRTPGATWVVAAAWPAGILYAANNLSDVANVATARGNIGAQEGNVTLNAISAGSIGAFSHRNKIINGNMTVAQRATSVVLTGGGFHCVDRWAYVADGTYNVTQSQQAFAVGAEPAEGLSHFLRTVMNSVSGQTYNVLVQAIEDVRTLNGKTATLSFWAKADSARSITPSLAQNFGAGGSGSVSTAGAACSLTTSWQKFTRTYSLPSITGKTIGTGTTNLALHIGCSINTAGMTIEITGVQLEEGPVATPFEVRPPSIELALCQRYFTMVGGGTHSRGGIGWWHNTTQAFVTLFLPVKMAYAPTLSHSGTGHWNIFSGATGIASTAIALDMYDPGIASVSLQVNVASGGTAGAVANVAANGTTAARINFSAEL